MKISAAVLALLFFSSLPARAQGVIHFGAGDTYLFTQPTLVGGKLDEAGARYFTVRLGYTGDLFTLGDSLQVDVLSTPTAVTNLATSTVSNPPSTYENGITFSWLGGPWDTANGAVRLTMLSGSVDVSSVSAITADGYTQRYYSYTIPEPGSSLLFLFSGAVLGGVHWFNRRKKCVHSRRALLR